MAGAAQALSQGTGAAPGAADLAQALRGLPGPSPEQDEVSRGPLPRFYASSVVARLLTIALLVAAVVSLLLAVPGLRTVASEISHLSGGWLALAAALELASCASFVVVFRHFFKGVPARPAKALAWTEMGSGALLPGGGLGSLAVGGWLLHLAGMPTRKIVRSSSGLFFLTSAVNVAALILGGSLLASGLSAGQHDVLRAGLPILVGSGAVGLALAVARLTERRPLVFTDSSWAAQLVGGIREAERALRHPSWRLTGAIGYLGFDIAVLAAALTAVGYSPPLAVLILGYIIGYLANAIPVPGAVGVLEGGLAGTLVLYGAPVTQATAGVLIYHAIAFWVPSIGGLLGYRLLRLRLARGATFAILDDEAPAQPPNVRS
ncbi:MAG: flippase-like protein [Solirubrobacterales bacterium]|nr:flippase-like protein [Solirubrobacterales bacterium]